MPPLCEFHPFLESFILKLWYSEQEQGRGLHGCSLAQRPLCPAVFRAVPTGLHFAPPSTQLGIHLPQVSALPSSAQFPLPRYLLKSHHRKMLPTIVALLSLDTGERQI